jgi:hypothetical protein
LTKKIKYFKILIINQIKFIFSIKWVIKFKILEFSLCVFHNFWKKKEKIVSILVSLFAFFDPVIRNKHFISKMEKFPEWGDGLTKKTPQILPPFYFYFKIIYIIKISMGYIKNKL